MLNSAGENTKFEVVIPSSGGPNCFLHGEVPRAPGHRCGPRLLSFVVFLSSSGRGVVSVIFDPLLLLSQALKSPRRQRKSRFRGGVPAPGRIVTFDNGVIIFVSLSVSVRLVLCDSWSVGCFRFEMSRFGDVKLFYWTVRKLYHTVYKDWKCARSSFYMEDTLKKVWLS